ncbi:MAG: hypothetical protein GY797_05195 [Deltaproteobacteria bacterium]|nr:hypothetical protein [Deltaproteobacteria bacterium]
MDTEKTDQETVESFKKSFFYGSRSDMNFKFFSTRSDDEVGTFFKKRLQNITKAYDNGTPDDLFNFVINAQKDSHDHRLRRGS